MEITLKPHPTSLYPAKAVLIKGGTLATWLSEISQIGLTLEQVNVYPIPGTTLKSRWGCLIVPDRMEQCKEHAHPICQVIADRIFIPSFTKLYPHLTSFEFAKFFPSHHYLVHPELGFVPLEERVEWGQHLRLPSLHKQTTSSPAMSIYRPSQVRRFLLTEKKPEEVLKQMEEQVVPKKKTFEDRPLNIGEKVKLFFMRMFFRSSEKSGRSVYHSLKERLPGKVKQWLDDRQLDYEDLEKRNQKELDKLFNLFEEDPEEALKYAIPLDNEGVSRGKGGKEVPLKLSQRWTSFSFSGQGRNTGGYSTSFSDEQFLGLRDQYLKTANELVKAGKYQKAAFVYLKLLKDHRMAASTLEQGGLYAEAAAVYLEYLKDKQKAAECYEKGRLTTQAIELYNEVGKYEKAGDLLLYINKTEEAMEAYEKVVGEYQRSHQFLKASQLLREKMSLQERAQSSLLEGWRQQADAFNCLNSYFSNIDPEEHIVTEINKVYKEEVSPKTIDIFLSVLVNEYRRERTGNEKVREMAYGILSERIRKNPDLASELNALNKEDKVIVKDVLRYKRHKGRSV